MRNWLIAAACLVAAALGIALFVSALDVSHASLGRSFLPFVAWRPKSPEARPLPDGPTPARERGQR
jgi:hypothetical protein